MKIRQIATNSAVIALASLVALGLSELGARVFLNAADYLSVEMVTDPILGAVPSGDPMAGGFDEWGFRNPFVPDSVDIVAIGDSHTYGNTARMEDSWPYVAARLSGQSVYNMGLGGYGPNQYFHLFNSRGLELKPKTIVVGLYTGDDFSNAFLMTYGSDYWAYLRDIPPEEVDFDIWEEPTKLSWHKKIRVWLSRNSVIYQVVVHGPILGQLKGETQIRNAEKLYGSTTTLDIPEDNILEAFIPGSMLSRLDQNSANIREGMRITFELLAEMNEISVANDIRFVVVIIPTKEMVFADYLENNAEIPFSHELNELFKNERLARRRIFDFLDDSGIVYVDTLPALIQSRSEGLYAKSATDMHPNMNGYRVIGETVAEAIQNNN